jgi:bifunctional non-homologous end joining protein LigD
MPLEHYSRKRDFTVTSEPKGTEGRKGGNSFVVQKHAARRLHYDFRLEMDGVLKSWAVTKGPSLVPGEKRLAVHVEDHPLEYGDFEGTIPKGEYGGGTVLVWDRGSWTPVHNAEAGYAKGHLEFELQGEKLRGRWHLVRMGRKPREKRENWLLIKSDDETARPADAPDILEEQPRSVKTGRSIDDVAGEKPGWSSKAGRIPRDPSEGPAAPTDDPPAPEPEAESGAVHLPAPSALPGAKEAPLPAFVEPMLASPQAKPPAGGHWISEIKFDGYRLQARIEAGRIKLLTRSSLDWTKKFGSKVVEAIQSLPVGTALIDGELVVEAETGAADFSALQADLSDGRNDRFAFYAFDLLYIDGFDLRLVPLIERKKLLELLIPSQIGPLRFSAHFHENGGLVLRHACRLGLEGIVAKRADSPYRSGRGKAWIKCKCSSRQEFVVAGYVPSSTSRKAIGSLVLGVYENDKLQHVGRVGTGFSHSVSEDLFQRLERIKMQASPFAQPLTAEERRQVRFVRPELAAEVEFRDWTADGHLRHASFRGLREDRHVQDIRREEPPAKSKGPASRPSRSVKLTHPDRVYWPDAGVTKEGLANYYTDVWLHIAPFVTGRPLALLRGPEGIAGETFFQKHAWKGLNENIVLVHDPKESGGEALISISGLDGLIALVQAAVLEIHPWGSTVAAWEQPDMIIIDLDPGPDVTWDQVIAAAREVRERLSGYGLASFVKTTGGKGLHVVAPLRPKAQWPAVKKFAKKLAEAMTADSRERFVSTLPKAERHGRILVDYLRNQRGQTAVAAFSTRARPGAAVSMPLSWEELSPGIGPAYFTIANAPKRLASLPADPWEGFKDAAVPLP